jgi:hypothetical protein
MINPAEGKNNCGRAMKHTPKGYASFILAGIVLPLFFSTAYAEINVEKLADAIYKAENSSKYPYGIKSINTYGNKDYARKICINTIKNNLKRFKKQTRYSDFIEFLGSRYCPVTIKSEYRLNKNWVRNVRHFYNGGVKCKTIK